jgi:hypothetical protein
MIAIYTCENTNYEHSKSIENGFLETISFVLSNTKTTVVC